uniref:Uncharacterized protein n=1 Tax=Glossina pallidipes TaxID=7398 RepID=A0A1B0A1F0_GLOPL
MKPIILEDVSVVDLYRLIFELDLVQVLFVAQNDHLHIPGWKTMAITQLTAIRHTASLAILLFLCLPIEKKKHDTN